MQSDLQEGKHCSTNIGALVGTRRKKNIVSILSRTYQTIKVLFTESGLVLKIPRALKYTLFPSHIYPSSIKVTNSRRSNLCIPSSTADVVTEPCSWLPALAIMFKIVSLEREKLEMERPRWEIPSETCRWKSYRSFCSKILKDLMFQFTVFKPVDCKLG